MKRLILTSLVLFSGYAMAQTNRTDGNGSAITTAMVIAANGANISSYGSGITFFNPKVGVDGSVYLLSNWENNAVIHTIDNRKFSLNNININLERNTFQSKFSKDSLFTFNYNNIDRFVINLKTYKNHYHDGENRIYQELYDGNGIQLLKGTKVKLIKASTNPMLNRSRDKYVQKESYFIRKDNVIKPIRLKKKDLMAYIDDKNQAEKILTYAKKQ